MAQDSYFDIAPSGFNILSAFKDYPDETLKMLQLGANYSLIPEQSMIARLSALELTNIKEITILDLAESWEAVPDAVPYSKLASPIQIDNM